jgi:hypothetical protein
VKRAAATCSLRSCRYAAAKHGTSFSRLTAFAKKSHLLAERKFF